MDIIGKTEPHEESIYCLQIKWSANTKTAEAYIEETCHTSTEATIYKGLANKSRSSD